MTRFSKLLCFITILLSACSQNSLQTAAKINLQYAKGLATVQSVARSAHETQKADGSGLVLSDANYTIWLQTAIKLNQGGQDVNNFLRAQAQLSPADQQKASIMIANLAKIVSDATNQDVIKISDPGLRAQIQVGLNTISTALNSAGIAIAAGGN